jgi:NAD(P)-dependent dehydrogenase (short-subunit alcohol dehydrogenase family)
MRMSDEAWADVLNVNLTGAFHMARAVLRPMLKARGGRIINMSSVSGQMGNAGQANHSASKAGLIGLTKALAREVASRGITVNAVAPGFVVTELTDGLPDSVKDAINAAADRAWGFSEIGDRPSVLVIDELGYLPMDATSAHWIFQVVSRRYERGSIVLTSNRGFGDWGAVLADGVVATAILDRLLHHATVVAINGDSYRMRAHRDAIRALRPAITGGEKP